MDEWGGCIGALIVLALAIWAIYAVLLGFAYVGMTVLIAIEYVAHGLVAIGVTNPTIAWLLLGVLVGGVVGLGLGFRRAGKRSAVPTVYAVGGVLFLGLLLASGLAPTPTRKTTVVPLTQSTSLPRASSQWRGTVGNSSAALDLIPQGSGAGWIGRLTYQDVVEELAVSMKDGGAMVLAGKSYRRMRGNGSFALDTFHGQLSADGQRIQGSYVDSAGHQGQWAVVRADGGSVSLKSTHSVESATQASRSSKRPTRATSQGDAKRLEVGPFRIGGGVSAPVVISKIEPEYSEEARQAKLQGKVLLAMVINTEGRATDVRVVRPLGMGLDEKAIEAVRKWRFRPGMKDNVPVPVLANVEVNFRLL